MPGSLERGLTSAGAVGLSGPTDAASVVTPQMRALAAVAARCAGGTLGSHARITVHFQPDRLHSGRTLLYILARDGVYRSQFETGTSNGGLTAVVGGDRWRWESALFDGAYDDAPAVERPKYGSLDQKGAAYGASPRFGSAFLRLRSDCLRRATFCFPDSVFGPTWFATHDRLATLPESHPAVSDPLDDYVEVHLHGTLNVAHDVEALVLDPCFQGTDVERDAEGLPCPIEWHPGFRLDVATLEAQEAYRGPAAVALGRELSVDGWLTPRELGVAAREGRTSAQTLKHLWHLLAAFGRRRDDGRP